jgi:tetratricopeptide (TPR) repeat protein
MLKSYSSFISLLIMASITVCFTVAAYKRNSVFQTPVTLWADASSKSVDKRRTHENYGQALSTAGSVAQSASVSMGLYNEALKQFKTVLALRDDSSVPPRDLYREVGVVYFRMGLLDDSIASWQTGLRFAPGDPSLLNNLSVAFIQKGRYDDAEATVRQALAVDPNMPHLLNTLGEILMTKGNYEEALKSFLAAIDRQPDTAARYWNAAMAFEKVGRYDKAYEYANQYGVMEADAGGQQRAQMYIDRLQRLYPTQIKH